MSRNYVMVRKSSDGVKVYLKNWLSSANEDLFHCQWGNLKEAKRFSSRDYPVPSLATLDREGAKLAPLKQSARAKALEEAIKACKDVESRREADSSSKRGDPCLAIAECVHAIELLQAKS